MDVYPLRFGEFDSGFAGKGNGPNAGLTIGFSSDEMKGIMEKHF